MTANVCREPTHSISDQRVRIYSPSVAAACHGVCESEPKLNRATHFNFNRVHDLAILLTNPNLLLILPVTTPACQERDGEDHCWYGIATKRSRMQCKCS
jgi:hypothetical protein